MMMKKITKNSTSIIFTGDIGFDKYMDHKWEDENFIACDVLGYLKSSDHLVINVEGPLSKQEKIVRENGVTALTHSMDPAAADFFEKLGADIWNINNNHIMDVSEKGIKDTLDIASKKGVKTLGAGMNIDEAKKPIILDEAGGIGLLAVGYERACRKAGENTPGCLNFSDIDIVKEQIANIKKECRWCVVVAHDGEEFTALPMPYTRDRYLSYLEMGADIVVAHHPHVPMNYETVGEKIIFYSLGNFIFDTDYQRSQFNTELGLFVKLNFTEKEYTFEPYGIKIDRDNGRVISSNVSDIFTDVSADEYEKLKPLAAKIFIENTKRQLRYLKPDVFNDATEEQFVNNFYEPLRSGRVPGKLLDFQIVYPLSNEYSEDLYNEYSQDLGNENISKVIKFMKKQI